MADKTWAELTREQRRYVRRLLRDALSRNIVPLPSGKLRWLDDRIALRAALAALPERTET